ncbi:hypothetical protein EVAR_49918_1 [Eumeta japonica]|uniref:Uncharacterized protein n=1 Tax=Eumeta variegata TaxID=151549 RepID=A0A4C1Y1B1_EUMVA|nr:hypothetical protein EVAR_49918_1 [Eumeta japonica]
MRPTRKEVVTFANGHSRLQTSSTALSWVYLSAKNRNELMEGTMYWSRRNNAATTEHTEVQQKLSVMGRYHLTPRFHTGSQAGPNVVSNGFMPVEPTETSQFQTNATVAGQQLSNSRPQGRN